MSFMLRDGWHCQFLEEDLKTSLRRKLNFKDQRKIIVMANRFGLGRDLESRQAIEHAISNGRGGVWLELSEAQYAKLLEA
jgi:hypothetical protein